MKQSKIITGIDIGTSKISAIVCQLKSADDIEVLGMGTSILKGIQKGLIRDESLFVNALQNCLKRAQASSNHIIKDVFVNVPNGNSRFVIETGIVQGHSDGKKLTKKDKELAMKKSIHCVEKKSQSVLHLLPINQRIDGKQMDKIQVKTFNHMEIDTGIILCDSTNLKTIFSNLKKCGLNLKGIISDYLSMGAILNTASKESHLLIDIGSQVTSFCVYSMGQLKFAHTIQIGSEQITQDLSVCLKCSISEAERVKILHGQLDKLNEQMSTEVSIQCHSGLKHVKLSLITSIIESRVNQLFQLIQKYLIHAPSYDNISLCGSGANLNGLSQWIESKTSRELSHHLGHYFKQHQINSNVMIAMGQIIYGHQIGLLKSEKGSFFKTATRKIFKD